MNPKDADRTKSLSEIKAQTAWYVSYNGRAIVRDGGELLFDGKEENMPEDIRKIANQMKTLNEFSELKTKLKETVPLFDHFNYQEVLDWAICNGAEFLWEDGFVSFKGGVETHFKDEKHAHYIFSWNFGFIGFDEFKKDELEQAKMAAALFAYLWIKGIDPGLANKLAVAYAFEYFDRISKG